nr:MAG: sel1 repeat family protein [Hyphomicrobiales bacterium]
MGILELPKIVASFIAARAEHAPGENDKKSDGTGIGNATSGQTEKPTSVGSAGLQNEQTDSSVDAPNPHPTGLVRQVPRARGKSASASEIDGIVKELTSNDQSGEYSIAASVARLERRVYVIERNLAEAAEKAAKEKAEGGTFAPEDIQQLMTRVSTLEKHLKEVIEQTRDARVPAPDRLRMLEATSPAGSRFSNQVQNSAEPANALAKSPSREDEDDPRDGKGDVQNKNLDTFLSAEREAAKKSRQDEETPDTDDDDSPRTGWKRKARSLIQGTTKLNKKTLLTRIVPIPVILIGLSLTTWAAISAGEDMDSTALETEVTQREPVIAIAPSPALQSAFSRMEALMAAAEAGDSDAQTLLGINYLHGDGVAGNPAEAARLLQLAAADGQAVAQYTLATIYGDSNSTMADPVAAKFWFQSAAEQGNRMAMNNLAMYYAQGLGAEQSTMEAAPWFAMAAALGYKVAQFNLAVLYERGDGVAQDFSEAYKWYAIAAAQGDEDARARAEILAQSLDADVLLDVQNEVAQFEPAAMDPKANNLPQFTSRAG